jgi:hypothetical protein
VNGWEVYLTWKGALYVIPIDDLRSHDPESEDCWCHPTDDEGVLVHHSMDRREEHEEGRMLS